MEFVINSINGIGGCGCPVDLCLTGNEPLRLNDRIVIGHDLIPVIVTGFPNKESKMDVTVYPLYDDIDLIRSVKNGDKAEIRVRFISEGQTNSPY